VTHASIAYQPRDPAHTVLHGLVRDHFERFRARAVSRRDGEGLPRFVEREFREFPIAGPFLAHLLYGVSLRDPLAITAGPAAPIVVAALAISLSGRRAMQQNPIVALRAE
jgi:hypothetical protein